MAEEEAKEKKGSMVKKLLSVLMIVVLVGGGVYFWQTGIISFPEKEPQLITSDPFDFTVNLADSQQKRYLKATVRVGYYPKELTQEIGSKIPEIRDLIIEVFRTKSVAEIDTTDGTKELREELRSELNERLELGEITEVYFTEFIIQ